ncbi:MAG: hypothetical protein FJX77_06655, partial [Armatimonadetes bacterium]|nr:hypothetical protein [Armatimonadota bacterium]
MKLRYTPGGRRSAWGSRTVVASVTGTGCLFLLAAAAHSQNARSAAPAPPRPAAPAAPAPDGVGTALALDSRQDPRLARELSVTARAAETSQFVAALGGSSGVRLRLGGGLTGRRITLHSERANLQSLQLALASLYHAQWRRESAATEAEYTLEPDPTLGDRVAVLRTERRARLVDALLKAEHAWRTQSGAALGGRLRREVAARLPDLPDEAIASLDANFLEQLGLVAPLRLRMGNTLVQSGSAWSPFRSLLARYQAMFAGFFAAETGSPAVVVAGGLPTAVGAAAAPPNLAPLTLPHARVEYKLLYGDRWTGPMLMVRVGVPDLWATSLLPSSLFAGTE